MPEITPDTVMTFRCPECGNRQPFIQTLVPLTFQLKDGNAEKVRYAGGYAMSMRSIDGVAYTGEWGDLIFVQPDDSMWCGDCEYTGPASEFSENTDAKV